jgi:hypothetical protein
VHQFGKNELVGLHAPFRDIHLVWSHGLQGFRQLGHPGEDTVDLKSVSPPFWIFVVLVQEIVACDMLPVFDRFRDGGDLGHRGHEGFEKSGFATADITFDRVDNLSHLLNVRKELFSLCVYILFFNNGYMVILIMKVFYLKGNLS